MIGLKSEATVTRKNKFPIYFEHKNICVHCGAENCLVFLDRFNNEFTKELEVFERMKCKKCNTEYYIRWDRNKDGDMKPSAIGYNIPREYNNFINN